MNRKIFLLGLSFIIVETFGQSTELKQLLKQGERATNKLYAIIDIDVFAYYGLTDYDTQLKKEAFKKSVEYSQKLENLKQIKRETKSKTFYIELENMFVDDDFGTNDYKTDKKGFELILGTNSGRGTGSARVAKFFYLNSEDEYDLIYDGNWIVLKSLPTKKSPMKFMGKSVKGVFEEKLFISLDEESGLEIEENREDVVIYLLFTPDERETINHKFFNSADNKWYTITSSYLKSDKTRMIIANRVSEKIYHDKIF